jgi:hypothetical protein
LIGSQRGGDASLGFSPERLQLNCLDCSTTNRNGACAHDSSTKFGLTYSYGSAGSNNGQISGISDSVDNGRSVTFGYDVLYRLTSAVIFRIRRNVQSDGKNGTVIEVQARVTNDEVQDQETASYAYELLERLASLACKNTAPSENSARETASPSAAKTTPVKSRSTSAKEGSPVPSVITKIDRMKTRQGDSLFLKVDVGGETVRVFGRPEELAERLEASGYDIPANEIEAGMELHLPCLVKVGQGHNGYKNIEEFLPEAAE